MTNQVDFHLDAISGYKYSMKFSSGFGVFGWNRIIIGMDADAKGGEERRWPTNRPEADLLRRWAGSGAQACAPADGCDWSSGWSLPRRRSQAPPIEINSARLVTASLMLALRLERPEFDSLNKKKKK